MPSLPADLREDFDRYTRGPSAVREAITGLDGGAINSRVGDSWSSRDVVLHLADLEIARAFRIRLVLSVDEPLLPAWDEKVVQRRTQYLWRSPEMALATFDLMVYSTAEILMRIDRAAWRRAGTHPDFGALTVAELMRRGPRHVEAHVNQIKDLRAAIGR